MPPAHGSDARIEPRSLLPWDYQPVKSRKEREDPHTYINGKKYLISEDGEAIEVNWGRPGPDPKYPAPEIVPNLIKKTKGRQAPTADQGLRGDTYTCEVTGCGKVFNRAHHLRRHMRSIHTYETRKPVLWSACLCIVLTLYGGRSLAVHRTKLWEEILSGRQS